MLSKVHNVFFSDQSKIDVKANSLTIKSVKKPDDIMCVLCIVSNSNGEKMGEACVNVICK